MRDDGWIERQRDSYHFATTPVIGIGGLLKLEEKVRNVFLNAFFNQIHLIHK